MIFNIDRLKLHVLHSCQRNSALRDPQPDKASEAILKKILQAEMTAALQDVKAVVAGAFDNVWKAVCALCLFTNLPASSY